MKKNKLRLVKISSILCLFFVFTFLALLHYEAFSKTNQVYIIKIKDDTINPITADYIIESIDKAYQDNAECPPYGVK